MKGSKVMEKELTQQELNSLYGSGIVKSVASVFKTGDINKLTKNAYHFITLYMSFIAHYSLWNFRAEYEDLNRFALYLQTTEYSKDKNRALQEADHWQTAWFVERHGAERQRVIANTIRQIVQLARAYGEQ